MSHGHGNVPDEELERRVASYCQTLAAMTAGILEVFTTTTPQPDGTKHHDTDGNRAMYALGYSIGLGCYLHQKLRTGQPIAGSFPSHMMGPAVIEGLQMYLSRPPCAHCMDLAERDLHEKDDRIAVESTVALEAVAALFHKFGFQPPKERK